MSTLELSSEFADELFKDLSNAGITVSIHKEERYFGDPSDVLMILENADHVLSIIVSIIYLWSIKNNATIKINGSEHKPTKQELDKEEIKKKLDQ